jgi:hypothetical protein
MSIQQAKKILFTYGNFKAFTLPEKYMIQEAIKTKEYHINIADKAERFLNECIAE